MKTNASLLMLATAALFLVEAVIGAVRGARGEGEGQLDPVME